MAVQTSTGTIRCAHCKDRHATVAQVRLCSTRTQTLAPVSAPPARSTHRSIFDVKGVNPDGSPRTARPVSAPPAVSYQPTAKQIVDAERAALKGAESAVPAGRYAIGPVDATKFYVIDKPTEGRWAGYVFVKVQASDEQHSIKNPAARLAILKEIALDPQAAMIRYGREIGKCGHCNRTLTDAESRAYGIGPICRGKLGW